MPTRTPAKTTAEPFAGIDLDASRAARLEASGPALPLRLGGKTYDLPTEVPLDVFSPLLDIDVDLAMLVRKALDAVGGEDSAQQKEATSLVIDLLVMNPNLPTDLLSAVKEVGHRLLGDDAYEALVAFRPSKEDLGVLAKGLFARYGVSLGEASASSASPESGGTTSNVISNGSTESTPEASGSAPATPVS